MKKSVSLVLVSALFMLMPMQSFALAEASSIITSDNFQDDINVNKMTQYQKQLFYEIIEVEVEKVDFSSKEEEELFRKELIALFTEENYTMKSVQESAYAARGIIPDHMGVTKKVMAAGLNTAIAFAVGGVGYGAVKAYILKHGKKAASRIFYKTIASRLTAWGAGKLAISLGVAVDFVINYSDFGARIADYWDKNDAVPNNGWCDFY